jgi:hypothetical protein
VAFFVAMSIIRSDRILTHVFMTKSSSNRTKAAARKRQSTKVGKVMHEYRAGTLHSGSKSGPIVHSRDQAVAIALHKAAAGRKRK